MSGGHFNYTNDNACSEIFGYGVYADYGLGDKSYKENVKNARNLNPMGDKLMSELVYDVFCVLHSLDWYESGDTGDYTYKSDVDYFKKKWLNVDKNEIVSREINKATGELRDELMRSLCVE